MKKLIPTFEGFVNEAKYSENNEHTLFAIDMLSLRNQIHIFHWQTEIGDLHRALGDFYGDLLDKLDDIVEIAMGKYGRISVKSKNTTSPLMDLVDINLDDYLVKHADLLNSYKSGLFSSDADIQNKIYELVADINKLRYLATMQ